MGVFRAIGEGIKITLVKARMVGGLWLINIVYALAVLTPFVLLLERDFGHSELSAKLGSFDPIWLGDLLFKYREMLPPAAGAVLAPLALYLLLSVFLNGGILGRIVDRRGGLTVQSFLSDCGKYWARFFRLFLLSLLLDLLVLIGTLGLLGTLFHPMVEGAGTEWTVLIFSNLPLVVALLLLTIVHIIFDYARILTAAGDEPQVLLALRSALRFIRPRFFRAWFLFLLIAALFAGGTAVGRILSSFLSGSGAGPLAAALLLSQAFIVFGIGIKVLFFSAQAEYCRTNRVSEDE